MRTLLIQGQCAFPNGNAFCINFAEEAAIELLPDL